MRSCSNEKMSEGNEWEIMKEREREWEHKILLWNKEIRYYDNTER